VTILDPVHCPRYAARLMTGLTWHLALLDAPPPAPGGLEGHQQPSGCHQLRATGVRQPLHAFDFQRLRGAKSWCACPRARGPFTTLDGRRSRDLDPKPC